MQAIKLLQRKIMKETKIPFIISITGHIDIDKISLDFVEKELNILFTELKNKLSNTPIYLMSALAEGSDRIVAKIALDNNIQLLCPLPFEKDEYKKDFISVKSKNEFEELISKSVNSYFVGYHKLNTKEHTEDRSLQYQTVGKHLSDNCNLLIALWDEKMLDKEGGTSWVISHKRKNMNDTLYSGLDGNAIVKIPIKRISSHNEHEKTTYTVKYEYLGEKINTKKKYFKLLEELNDMNTSYTQENIQNSSKNTFEIFRDYFDNKAIKYQSSVKKSTTVMVIFSWFAVLSLELLHNFQILWTMFVYVFIILFMFGYFHFKIKKNRIEDSFIFYRGLCEALRIQNYWNMAGIKETVSKFYLKKQFFNLVWMKLVLKNIYVLKYFINNENEAENIKLVKTDWVENQLNYFNNNLKSRKEKYYRLEHIEHVLYKFGLIFTVITIIVFLGKFFHLEIGLTHEQLKFLFHFVLFLSGILLVTAAYIGEKYLPLTGYKEEITSFEIAHSIFKQANILLEDVNIDQKFILKELGKEALEENSQWVLLHDGRKISPSLE